MKNKKLLLFLIPLLFFIPKNTFALNYHNSYTNFTYDSQPLNVAQFYTFQSGNKPVIVNGALALSNDASNLNFTGYMYINLNLCSDMNLTSINTPNNIDNMYVYQSGQSCTFNGSSYKGKVFNIYFRIIKPSSRPVSYEGSFYLNISNEHSVEFINYYANPGGFPMNNNQSYTSDLNELKEILRSSNSSIKDSIDKNTEENKKTNDLIENTDTSDSQTKGANFFKDYNSNAHGLSGIITAPLKFLQSLTGAKCNPLKFNLPFVKKEVQLQCMKSIYQTHFGVFYTLWQTITTGLIAYTVCLNFYKKIRDLQNPNNDKIEVLNL